MLFEALEVLRPFGALLPFLVSPSEEGAGLVEHVCVGAR